MGVMGKSQKTGVFRFSQGHVPLQADWALGIGQDVDTHTRAQADNA